MARNRARDPSDLRALIWSSKGLTLITLILAPLPCSPFFDTQKARAASAFYDARNAIQLGCSLHVKWFASFNFRNLGFYLIYV